MERLVGGNTRLVEGPEEAIANRRGATKRALRRRMLKHRLELPDSRVRNLSLTISRHFLSSPFFINAHRVALYAAINNEVDPAPILEACFSVPGKIPLLPRVREKGVLEFVAISPGYELVPGFKGIPEPVGECTPVRSIDVFLVPGLLFDERGHRIGYGKGYYDRVLSLARSGAAKVGLGYGFQIVPELPAEEGDIALDAVLTERGVAYPPGG